MDREALQSEEMQKLIGTVLRGQSDYEKKTKLERFRRLNRFVRPGQIVFAGSSLTEQFPVHELLTDKNLPYAVYNRGIGGYTTAELLDVMDVCVYDLHPKCLFMNIGTNDLNEPQFDEESFAARYEEILCGIKEHLPDAVVYVQAFYPVNPAVSEQSGAINIFRYRTNERVQEANACVRALSEKMGVQYLNLNAGLTDENGSLKAEYTADGVHMYANGYMTVLENLLPVLRRDAAGALSA